MTMTAKPPAKTVRKTSEILQAALVELIDLSIQGKQAHWTVTGPLFKPVHEHLDAIVDEVRAAYDDVAERMAALEVAPDGTLATVIGTSPAEPMPAGWQPDTEAVGRDARPPRGAVGPAGRLDRRTCRPGPGEPGHADRDPPRDRQAGLDAAVQVRPA